MARGMRLVFGSAAVLLAGAAAGAQSVQVPLSYNVDVVREPGGSITGGRFTNDRFEFGIEGRGFVTQSVAVVNDPTDPHGLPDDGRVTLPGGGSIQLGPYNGNNAVRLGTFGTSAEAF